MTTLTKRFATVIGDLPDRAQAPLWRAWSDTDTHQQRLMLAVAERTYGARNAPLDPYGKYGVDDVFTWQNKMAAQVGAGDVSANELEKTYRAVCAAYKKREDEAKQKWSKDTGRPIGPNAPDILDTEWQIIWRYADRMHPGWGFEKKSGRLCINHPLDTEIRKLLRHWQVHRAHSLQLHGSVPTTKTARKKHISHMAHATSRAILLNKAIRKAFEKFKRLVPDLLPKIPLPTLPGFNAGGLLLIAAIVAGVLVLK